MLTRFKASLAAISIAAGCFAGAASAADITGAGATFPYPIYASGLLPTKLKPGLVSTISQLDLVVVLSKSRQKLLILEHLMRLSSQQSLMNLA